jgi:hypothetical protein
LFVYKTKWINESYTLGCVSKVKAKEAKFNDVEQHIREADDRKIIKWEQMLQVSLHVLGLMSDQPWLWRTDQPTLYYIIRYNKLQTKRPNYKPNAVQYGPY